jgi:uncharacterized protein (UPF0332 family)
MDSMVKIYLKRAENEINAADILFKISLHKESKKEFNIEEETTFYSSVISHSYYAIFYASKGLLLTKNVKTSSPEVHKKTYDEFKKTFVDTGILDVNLLNIYKKMIIKADQLLQIFKDERWKRGHFTYETVPQANKEPANESIKHAKLFVSNIKKVLEEK